MSDINLDFTVSNNSINFTVEPNDITFTPTDIQLTFNTSSQLNAGGSNTQLQYNNGSLLAGIPTATYNGSNLSLGNVANLKITGGVNGYVLQTDGTGNLDWAAAGGGGGNGSPGGSNTQIQYNDSGAFGGNTGFTFNEITGNVNIPGNLIIAGTFSGAVANANYANYAGNAFSVSGSNVVGTVANANYSAFAGQANTANLSTFATTANAVAGANVSGTVANATYAISAGTANTVTTNAQPNITSLGTLTSVSVSGNLTSGNANLGNLARASFFQGSGANLTNLPAANIVGTVPNANFATNAGNANFANSATTANSATVAGSATTAGTVTTNAQPNITSTGTLTSLKVNGISNFVAVTNLLIPGGSNGQYMRTDGNGNISFSTVTALIGGSNTQVQFNDGGNANGNASLTFDKTTGTLTTANLVTSTTANLGSISNVKITGGTNGYILQTDGAGNLTWTPQTGNATGNGTVGGSNTQIQFNNAGNFGGSAGFTFDNTTNAFSIPGSLTAVGNISTTGTTTIQQTKEKIVANATAATGTVNFDVLTSAFILNTSNATANFTLNIRGNSSVTLDTVMNVNESLTCTFVNRNSTSPRYANVIQIDGNTITPVWAGGTAPSSGTSGGRDAYTFNILKTAGNTYTVLAIRTGYA